MNDTLFTIMRSSEALDINNLEKLNTWVEFLLAKRRRFEASDSEKNPSEV